VRGLDRTANNHRQRAQNGLVGQLCFFFVRSLLLFLACSTLPFQAQRFRRCGRITSVGLPLLLGLTVFKRGTSLG
jgi:hypothetical protein